RGSTQLGDTVLGDRCDRISLTTYLRLQLGNALPRVVRSLATGELSLSPVTSYWRKMLPRTHSMTPDLASRSSSSCLKLKGKVPNFFCTSERILREVGRLSAYVLAVRRWRVVRCSNCLTLPDPRLTPISTPQTSPTSG